MECSSSCRQRLECLWSLRLFPSRRPGCDFIAHGPLPQQPGPLVDSLRSDGQRLCVRLRDEALIDLGFPPEGARGRWLSLKRWSQAFHPGPPRPPLQLRSLWLLLDAALYGDSNALAQLVQGFHHNYASLALLGSQQARSGYPQLAEMIGLAGPLERLQKGSSSLQFGVSR